MPSVVVIDYGVGNLRSVAKAITFLGGSALISDKAEDIRAAERLVLPGVGAFDAGMRNLEANGCARLLKEEVLEKKKPFLGICLGMQLLADSGTENGLHPGLGLIPGTVNILKPQGALRLPHVGWNDVRPRAQSPLFTGLPPDPIFYFVHSYHLSCKNPEALLATCDYGGEFCAALQWGNIAATQFHPEKSQEIGLHFLENFLRWQPARVAAAA